ncbi:hypothetical protein K450DRAFT_231516 [Umbelopsis ramanniana AG]|uniref:Uncharacterized protein n=1 Tax=Umbelopsis ramanniana AG TaxID=1314678 RepID=A0AAD5ECM9_UMBRA|nr:uncharacterized protein K450DRAFT_231516 [Umbelopsis ramanniana AG]KAI8581488.1 hypothetical protein K450DRAFT_231516 [Umbelopsis ramanniana AG]
MNLVLTKHPVAPLSRRIWAILPLIGPSNIVRSALVDNDQIRSIGVSETLSITLMVSFVFRVSPSIVLPTLTGSMYEEMSALLSYSFSSPFSSCSNKANMLNSCCRFRGLFGLLLGCLDLVGQKTGDVTWLLAAIAYSVVRAIHHIQFHGVVNGCSVITEGVITVLVLVPTWSSSEVTFTFDPLIPGAIVSFGNLDGLIQFIWFSFFYFSSWYSF